MNLQLQQVVAMKTLIEGQPCWMLCKVIKLPEENETKYVLEDITPEKDSVAKYEATIDSILLYPQPDLFIKKGQKLLTVWYETDQQSWTSILYPCTALEDYPQSEEPESIVLKVQFDGDSKFQYINVQWVIMMPE
ncbi:SGF29_tudor-like domain-containing protei [Hexamita inflata]|uniref:SGF29_tudor-like domain-containing protei n=1 Tax=Hexamita inflata TaxID=28002 RepID=A0ABP1GGE8_9EUKA